MKLLSSLLRVDQRPDSILLAINQKQQHGSCKWLTADDAFQKWLDDWQEVDPITKVCSDSASRILWLNGRPGTGKSVAAGHVIKYMEACNLDCSFYFFKHDDKGVSTVSSLLRSLAYQMAESSFDIRRCIMAMVHDGVQVNRDDHHMIWKTVFVDRILKLDLTRPHFWVIDAVDECSSKEIPALISMISTLSDPTSNSSIRIFMTSRPGGQVERLLNQDQTPFFELNTGQAGSLDDIELFLAARCPQASKDSTYRTLVADVLSKSNGIFLWASLTMTRLENTYSVEDMQEILQQMPTEMDAFYSRIIASIVASPSSDLARCILKWTICSPKPMTLPELADAVKWDIGRTLTASPSQLETITGHLVFVDDQARIHVTHQTTSAYLTQKTEGFWIDRTAAHSQIAELCLAILCGPEFAPPRTRRGSGVPKGTANSPLADYATVNFAYHLMHSSAAADAPLILLNRFLRSNVLTWIERTISINGLAPIQHAAQRLQAYMRRRAKYQPPVSIEIQTVSGWVSDISHIVAVFHSCLLASPFSIYFLVPHFCPPKSITRQLFAKPSKRLKITGSLEDDWSDRLTCYLFSVDASAIACSEQLLAVGLHSGDFSVYNGAGSGTFNSLERLSHGKRVRQLGFSHKSALVFSCSARKLKLWKVDRSKGTKLSPVWSQALDFTPSDVSFNPDGSHITVSNPQGSAVVTFSVLDGTREEPVLLHGSLDSDSSDESDKQLETWTPAMRIRLDTAHRLAAISYRNASVALWDLEMTGKIGEFKKEGFENAYASPAALDMIFNPVEEIGMLAISYKDGDVVTINPDTLEQECIYHLQLSLTILATTSNGRILAGGAEDGSIHLFHFETLVPFYRITPPNEQTLISNLTFSADNLRLFDTRGQCCNVWEPFALVQKDRLDDSSSESQSDEVAIPDPVASQAHVFCWGEAITVLEQTVDGNYIFAGRQDGTIDIYDVNSGEPIEKLRLHGSFAEIQYMDWNDNQKLLLSADTTGRCIVTQLIFGGRNKKPQTKITLDYRENSAICQVYISPNSQALLIRTDSAIKLVDMQGNSLAEESSTGSVCMPHPTDNAMFIVMLAHQIHLLEWTTLSRLSPPEGIPIFNSQAAPERTHNPWASRLGSNYLATTFVADGRPNQISALRAADLNPGTTSAPLQTKAIVSLGINTLLGPFRSGLYFLDTTGWVCSIALKNLHDATHYTRHFFIPPTWQTGTDVVLRIISKTAVAFARGEQLIVFHGFLEFEEVVPFE